MSDYAIKVAYTEHCCIYTLARNIQLLSWVSITKFITSLHP